MRRLVLALSSLLWLLSCSRSPSDVTLSSIERQAISDSVLMIFDSLIAIHQLHPDTALLGRLYPAADTLLYVQGGNTLWLTGGSLKSRVMTAHRAVRAIAPRALDRRVQVLDRNNAVATAVWDVNVLDTTGGSHPWRGPLTVIVGRRQDRWVIRAQRE